MRGKRYDGIDYMIENRITPAGAGKTISHQFFQHHIRDHPRRCGENYVRDHKDEDPAGSPPQVRGKPDTTAPLLLQQRITPAGAGKTYASVTRGIGDEGSPPQVRGKLYRAIPRTAQRRITPAGAGKTNDMCVMTATLRDHPRRCGENGKVQI